MFNTLLTIGVVLVAFLTAFVALLALSWVEMRRRKSLRDDAATADDQLVFLFDNETLCDATPAARHMLLAGRPSGPDTEWQRFAQMLQNRFPDLTKHMGDLADLGTLTLTSADGSNRIIAEWRDGLARIELIDCESHTTSKAMDRLSFDAMQHELETLRATSEHLPLMVWREDKGGAITWANKSYLDLAEKISDPENLAAWPPQKVFQQGQLVDVEDLTQPGRVAVQLADDETRHWFDLHNADLGSDRLYTAIPADRIVQAESSRNEFITTLTKTFAHLPIGLAIFDRKRQLTLFNPALTDLVALPVDFLVGRPTLSSFLDRLREKRMMPEPKDYISWRQQMSDLEAAAVNGTYEETWSLPTGQTYRVTGRPHPDGAVAFLFEDISAEISLTRRFRAELEMGQAALDGIGDAIAIFNAGGVLSMSNKAYSTLWQDDPSVTLGDVNLGDAVKTWRKACSDTPLWRKLKEFVASNGEREAWSDNTMLSDGQMLTCSVTPMMRGATMVRFGIAATTAQTVTASEKFLPAGA
ncbi:PAS-domain containing protein [Aliiroseovarius sp. F47248L]|uniref:PAS-domain containing protein n=1 Tax=Aliiroseovarius sp. F47248L TaxID=2926420 RepID=UPI001FF4852E|nr:PAS-domain containing protein [Aliiroseovarius sp. F47248L]MCK0140131.1 PAS-domain containing protein [Aliiroseovarius sp. F47248L]